MKPLHLITLILVLMLPACKAFEVKRTVENNLFSSTYPKINIQVSSDFTFKDRHSKGNQFRDTGFEIQIPGYNTSENFEFYTDDTSDNKPRFILIQTRQITGHYYIPQDFYRTSAGSMLMTGEPKIHGEVYNHGVWMCNDDEKGILLVYQLRKCYSHKACTDILCVEPLSSYTNESFDWSKPKKLSEKQKEIVQAFVEQSRKGFAIIK